MDRTGQRLALWLICGLTTLIISACTARPPFPDPLLHQAHTEPTPIATTHMTRTPASPVAWGGEIIAIKNNAQNTLLTVLAYPLDSNLKPQLSAAPVGRFRIRQPGFLDPLIYAPGRLLSVIGKVHGFQKTQIGQQPYRLPTLSPVAIHLWPLEPSPSSPRFQFGLGIGISSGF